jgi:hypothetical protein
MTLVESISHEELDCILYFYCRRAVRGELNELIWIRYRTKDTSPVDKACKHVETYP